MNDVMVKLDGLSPKDLLSSYRFPQVGVNLLNISLGKSKPEKATFVKYGTQDCIREASRALPSGIGSGIMTNSL